MLAASWLSLPLESGTITISKLSRGGRLSILCRSATLLLNLGFCAFKTKVSMCPYLSFNDKPNCQNLVTIGFNQSHYPNQRRKRVDVVDQVLFTQCLDFL